MSSLSREEFLSYMDVLKSGIDAGFVGVHRRQDITNGRIAKAEDRLGELEQSVAVLEAPDAVPGAEHPQPPALSAMKGRLATAVTVGAGLAGAIKVVWDALK